MPEGTYIYDEYTHLGPAKAYYHRNKIEIRTAYRKRRAENIEEYRKKEQSYRNTLTPEAKNRRRLQAKEHRRIHGRKPCKRSPEYNLLANARSRAKRGNYPCTITMKDIVIPEFCPITDLKLVFGIKKKTDSSPSLDKIIPKLGYIPENVRVISSKANRWKNEMTRDDIQRLLDYVDRNI